MDLHHGKQAARDAVGRPYRLILPSAWTQHRRDKGSAYCRKYGIKLLVLAEQHDRIEDAIAREKAQKV